MNENALTPQCWPDSKEIAEARRQAWRLLELNRKVQFTERVSYLCAQPQDQFSAVAQGVRR
jgi:hypothetical protein